MTENDPMNQGERHEMMKSMMAEIFGGMDTDEKKEMCATMMGKMTEGIDMKEMMPKMMMGMMSGGGDGAGKMKDMMAKKMQGGPAHEMPCGPAEHMSQMPEMMLKTMMPHCIGMMLPAIDPDQRGEVAAGILSTLVEKGCGDLSDAQRRAFRKALDDVLKPSA